MKRRVLILALAAIVLALAQVPVTAAEVAANEVPSFDGFLQALSGPLVAAMTRGVG